MIVLPDYLAGGLALIAGVLAKHNHRSAGLAFAYGIVTIAFGIVAQAPVLEHAPAFWWYLGAAAADAMIVCAAWAIRAPASPFIAVLVSVECVINIAISACYSLALGDPRLRGVCIALWHTQRVAIPLLEFTELCILFAFTWPAEKFARAVVTRRRKAKHKDGPCQRAKLNFG